MLVAGALHELAVVDGLVGDAVLAGAFVILVFVENAISLFGWCLSNFLDFLVEVVVVDVVVEQVVVLAADAFCFCHFRILFVPVCLEMFLNGCHLKLSFDILHAETEFPVTRFYDS